MSNNDHISKLQADKSHIAGEGNGCVTRCVWEEQGGKRVCTFDGHDYPKNGHDYQAANEADWYNLEFHKAGAAQDRFHQIVTKTFKQTWRDPTQNEKAWYIADGPYAHLNFTGRRYWPWGNNAHHIVPVGSLHSALADGTGDQLRVLQAAKYNINKGVNIIYLPTSVIYGRLFQLPTHAGYHATYNSDLKTKLEEIADEIREAISDAKKEGEKHPTVTEETAPRLASRLDLFSEDMRKDLRAVGLEHPGSTIDEVFTLLGSR